MLGQDLFSYISKKMKSTKDNNNIPAYFDLSSSGKGEFPFPDCQNY